MRELCLPVGISTQEIEQLDELVYTRRRIKRGDVLYRSGSPFTTLYAVRSGFFKTTILQEDGRDQVTGFHMAGEIMGLDGIGSERQTCDAIALEDSVVCAIPFSRLEQLSREMVSLQRHFHKIMSREIVREHGVMLLLGSMRAEQRLSTFLLNLSQRYLARGFFHTEFNLRMTREEIGSYIGLKLETVSRLFSKFQDNGLITVSQRHINLKNIPALKEIIGQQC